MTIHPEFWGIITSYQTYALTAFVVAVFATPIAIRLAFRYRVLDIPDQKLKPHAKPIPYLGGAAILTGWVVALVVSLATGTTQIPALLPILLGGIGISVIGLLDDIMELPAKLRLGVGALIIAIVILTTGAGLELVDAVLHPLGIFLPVWLSQTVSFFGALFIVLGAVNSTNLIDGLDGLCSGVTAIISAGFLLLATHLAAWETSVAGDPVRLVLATAMLGAALGFLPFNFNPARIFMGDAGSVLLGYNCGILILLFSEPTIFRWVLGALVIFALPVLDTALAVFRRWRSGRPIFEGDRSHFYDQLVQRGLTVKQTVLVCYGLTVLFALLGSLVILDREGAPLFRAIYLAPFYVVVVAIIAGIAWRSGMMRPEARQ